MFRPEKNDRQIQQSSNRSDDSVRFYDVHFEDIKFQSLHVGVKYKHWSLQGYVLVYKYEVWIVYEYIRTKSLAVSIKKHLFCVI